MLSFGDGDGTAGLKMIKKHGGLTMVQSPSSAAEPTMPRNAILGDSPDQVVPVECLGGMLRACVGVG
ncbi:MAG: hypothetical protein EOO28_34650 [Comamonadaceae bacterium]|nr:MAG: hypothetical protein EOO28_34650 [Comamonadaceae bacterium]